MVAVVSSTYDSKYFYFLPITAWCWYKLGVKVICFLPDDSDKNNVSFKMMDLVLSNSYQNTHFEFFNSPEHKTSTYSQCLRNYAACLDLPDDELLITSDIDMGLFKLPEYIDNGLFSVFGYDLVPKGQYPQCYVTAPVRVWREAFNLSGKTYQQAIDELLGEDECEHYRGCRWSVDQEQSFLNINKVNHNLIPRARPGTQFASNRVDRDDINWRAYVNDELVDAHLWRPGYTEENFANIMELLTMKYPNEDFTWLRTYNEQYKQLL
jgi:hypothetical protein